MKVLTNEAKDLSMDKAGQLNGETSAIPAEHLMSVSSIWICIPAFYCSSLQKLELFSVWSTFFVCVQIRDVFTLYFLF